MSEPAPPAGALETARALQGALEGVSDDLKTISERLGDAEKAQRRSRHIITGLIVSFCLDLLVTAGVGWNAIRVDETQNSSHADLISSCQQANVARQQDAAVWDTFLSDIAPPGARTPEVRVLLAGIDERIRAKDALHNCAAQYRTR